MLLKSAKTDVKISNFSFRITLKIHKASTQYYLLLLVIKRKDEIPFLKQLCIILRTEN